MTRLRRSGRGLTLVEVIAAIGLVGALVTAMLAFMSNLQGSRTAALNAAASQRAASIFIEHLERDLITCLVGDSRSGSGVKGDAATISILTRAVSPPGLDSEGAGLGDLQRSEYGFDAAIMQLMIGRAGRGVEQAHMEALGGQTARLRLRYHDGGAWRDSFDSLSEGHLPQAVEACVWFTWIGDLPEAKADPLEDADDGGDDDTESEGPAPDRRRVIVIPDAGAQAAGGSS